MKILILTTYEKKVNADDADYQKFSNYRIYKYFSEKGAEVEIGRYLDLEFVFSRGKTLISLNQQDLLEYDVVFLRTSSSIGANLDQSHLAPIVAKYLQLNGIKVVNGNHVLSFPAHFNKLFQMQHLHALKLPIPQTYYPGAKVKSLPNLFPLVAKPLVGTWGMGVRLLKTPSQLEQLKGEYLFQEVLPNRRDYRVVVVAGRALGAIERVAANNKIVSNISAGGQANRVELTAEMRRLAEAAAQAFKLDFCGVDLMKDASGELRILEVNKNTGILAFEDKTGIIVSQHLWDQFVVN